MISEEGIDNDGQRFLSLDPGFELLSNDFKLIQRPTDEATLLRIKINTV